jgi:replicative DNA helicase
VIAVDYIQIATMTGKENRNLEVAAFSQALKAMARELDVPVVALSQLNRDVARQEREPRLCDLRDSGALEQDADEVILLHRKNKDRHDVPHQKREETDVIVAKNRNGPTGAFKMRLRPECRKLENYAE